MVLGAGPPAAAGTRLLPPRALRPQAPRLPRAAPNQHHKLGPQGLRSAGEFTVANKTLRPNILIKNLMKNLIVEKHFLHRLQKAAQEYRGNC